MERITLMINFELHDNSEAFNTRLSNYPKQITDGFSHCLKQSILTYDITDMEIISSLSFFCDLVTVAIETQIINYIYKIEQVIENDFVSHLYEGECLRYLCYSEPIKSAILHSLKIFNIAFLREFESHYEKYEEKWIDDLILEELADNVAYHIDILTIKNKKHQNFK